MSIVRDSLIWHVPSGQWLTGLFATDLSLEFLMGRALDNAMLNVGKKEIAKGMNFACGRR